jgi:hypothetical protein
MTTREFIKKVLENLSFDIVVDAVYIVNGVQRLHTKFTSYANKNTITFDGDVVVGYKINKYIEVKSDNIFQPGDIVKLHKPLFYEGILKRASEQVTKDPKSNLRPSLYLVEPRKEKTIKDPESNITHSGEIRIFFIAPTDDTRQVGENHTEVIETLNNGFYQPFFDTLYDRRDLFRDVWEIDRYDHEQFLSETLKKYFGNKSSAIEGRFNLSIKKNNYICNK